MGSENCPYAHGVLNGQHLTDVRIRIVRVPEDKRIVAAGLDTSRLLADSKLGVQTEVAVLCGLRFFVNETNVVRTSGNAVLAADAAGIVHGHDVGGRIYVRSTCRADSHAGRLGTLLAGMVSEIPSSPDRVRKFNRWPIRAATRRIKLKKSCSLGRPARFWIYRFRKEP